MTDHLWLKTPASDKHLMQPHPKETKRFLKLSTEGAEVDRLKVPTITEWKLTDYFTLQASISSTNPLLEEELAS